MKGKITKLSDNVNALRTESMTGDFYSWPEVGGRFTIFGKALSIPDGFRMIATFVVQRIVSREYLDDGAMTVVFNTENSTYKLEEL